MNANQIETIVQAVRKALESIETASCCPQDPTAEAGGTPAGGSAPTVIVCCCPPAP